MSAPAPSQPLPPNPPPPSGTGGPNRHDSNKMRGGGSPNYFYGFLVTFGVLLLIFISCGIRTRRRYFRRRRMLMHQLEFWDGTVRAQGGIPSVAPRLWEQHIQSKEKGDLGWTHILPLAVLAKFVTPAPPKHLVAPPPPAFTGIRLGAIWPLRQAREQQITMPIKDPAPITHDNVSEVVVVIQMPQAQTQPRDGEKDFIVYELGVAKVSCTNQSAILPQIAV